MAKTNPRFLYETIASDLVGAIEQGVYGVGDRMPSLREIASQFSVSLSTAIQAYEVLEYDGRIAARPKSGFYVSAWQEPPILEPAMTRPALTPTTVSVGQLAMSLVSEARSSELIKLGAAVPGADMLPLKIISRTFASISRRYVSEVAQYEMSGGNLLLRKQIARLMREAGCRCHPDDIIITNGCLEALSLALRAIAKAGDTVLIESPTYFGVLQVLETLGMRVLEIATHALDGIDLSALSDVLKQQTIAACILMPSFNNPLGSCMPETHKRRVVKLLADANVPLIEDDVYGLLSYEQPRPTAAKAYDEQDGVLYCSSFSKTVAPGLRIGWIVAGRYREQVAYLKFLGNISTAIHPQLMMAEFLTRDSFRRRLRQASRVYRRRMERLRYWTMTYFPVGTRISNPRGAFVLWVELPVCVDCLALYRAALVKKIAISPGIIFSAQGQYRHHIRLSCAEVEGDTVRDSLQILGRLAHQLQS